MDTYLVWIGLVWFNFEWYGAWILSRCSSLQNFEFLAWKTTELGSIYRNLVWFGMVRSDLVLLGLVLNGIVHGYCLYIAPCYYVFGKIIAVAAEVGPLSNFN